MKAQNAIILQIEPPSFLQIYDDTLFGHLFAFDCCPAKRWRMRSPESASTCGEHAAHLLKLQR